MFRQILVNPFSNKFHGNGCSCLGVITGEQPVIAWPVSIFLALLVMCASKIIPRSIPTVATKHTTRRVEICGHCDGLAPKHSGRHFWEHNLCQIWLTFWTVVW
jgi:hypothetical protein